MLFTFNAVPQAQPCDLTKSFDSLQTSPQISAQIQEITNLRNNFYATLGQLTTKPLNEMVTEVQWMPLMTYLNKGPDLLEFGVKKANYPFTLNYQPFSNSGLVVNGGNGNLIVILFHQINFLFFFKYFFL